jgi:hypothetical protein
MRRARAAILLMLACGALRAQEAASPQVANAGDALPGALTDFTSQAETTKKAATPCLEPAPLLRWQDYHGPFQKVVGAFAQKLELATGECPLVVSGGTRRGLLPD